MARRGGGRRSYSGGSGDGLGLLSLFNNFLILSNDKSTLLGCNKKKDLSISSIFLFLWAIYL